MMSNHNELGFASASPDATVLGQAEEAVSSTQMIL